MRAGASAWWYGHLWPCTVEYWGLTLPPSRSLMHQIIEITNDLVGFTLYSINLQSHSACFIQFFWSRYKQRFDHPPERRKPPRIKFYVRTLILNVQSYIVEWTHYTGNRRFFCHSLTNKVLYLHYASGRKRLLKQTHRSVRQGWSVGPDYHLSRSMVFKWMPWTANHLFVLIELRFWYIGSIYDHYITTFEGWTQPFNMLRCKLIFNFKQSDSAALQLFLCLQVVGNLPTSRPHCGVTTTTPAEPVKPLIHSLSFQQAAGYSLWCGSAVGMITAAMPFSSLILLRHLRRCCSWLHVGYETLM